MKSIYYLCWPLAQLHSNHFAQATAKEFYDKGIKLIEDKDYENALAAFKKYARKKMLFILMLPIGRLVL